MRGSNGGEITRTFRCTLSKVVVAQYINDNEFELKRGTDHFFLFGTLSSAEHERGLCGEVSLRNG